jgi:hypothetical protein
MTTAAGPTDTKYRQNLLRSQFHYKPNLYWWLWLWLWLVCSCCYFVFFSCLLRFSVHFVSNIQILWHMALCGLVQDWAACTLKVEAAVCSEEPLFTNLHGVVSQKTRI